MMGDILAMVSLKYENVKLQAQFGGSNNCPFDVSKDQAYTDYIDNNSTLGLMACYCLSQFYKDSTGFFDIKFTDIRKNDPNFYCKQWS